MDCGPQADQRLGRATRPPSRSTAIAETDAADEATVVAAVARCRAVTDRLEIHPVLLDAVAEELAGVDPDEGIPAELRPWRA